MALHPVADDDDAVPADVNQYRTLLTGGAAGDVLTATGGGGDPVFAAPRELLMQDGVTSPPVPLETEDGTDWLYEDR